MEKALSDWMEAAGLSVVVEQVGEIGVGLVMVGFVSEVKDFELDLLWDREPVGEEHTSGCTGVYLGLWMMLLQ